VLNLLKYLASSAFRLAFRIFSYRVCIYLRGHVYCTSASHIHPVCYIYVTHYPHSPYKISICGYLGPEKTSQNIDMLAGYKGHNIEDRVYLIFQFENDSTSGDSKDIFLWTNAINP